MRLLFLGHRTVATQQVSLEELRTRCRRHGDTGCFLHNGRWEQQDDLLTVVFKPVIFLNSTLSAQAAEQAAAHEQRHFEDFRRQADALWRDLNLAIAQRREPEMDARWAWFLYDLCTDSASFHREIGAPVDLCMPPSSNRPR